MILSYYKTKKSYPLFLAQETDSLSYLQKLLQEENRNPQKKINFIPAICYEILSGDYIRKFPDKDKAGFILNVTNDRWFSDDSKESYQHLQLGLFRAVENRKSLIRNTNSGVSAFIDATGKINSASLIPQAKKDFRIVQVPFVKEKTLFQILGNWPPKFFFLVFQDDQPAHSFLFFLLILILLILDSFHCFSFY